jgi:hypothetical protein
MVDNVSFTKTEESDDITPKGGPRRGMHGERPGV